MFSFPKKRWLCTLLGGLTNWNMIGPCAIPTPIKDLAQSRALLYNCTVTGTRLLPADGTVSWIVPLLIVYVLNIKDNCMKTYLSVQNPLWMVTEMAILI